jgi:peptide chain release factor 2
LWTKDQKKAVRLQTELSKLKETITDMSSFSNRYQEANDLLELAKEENDNTLLHDVNGDLESLSNDIHNFFLKSMLNQEADQSDCFIELRAGSGGTESCDWVQILSRMYLRWASLQNLDAKLVDFMEGEVAGYKSATIQVHGPYAFGWAKYEAGVHRFVRVSPFDSNVFVVD